MYCCRAPDLSSQQSCHRVRVRANLQFPDFDARREFFLQQVGLVKGRSSVKRQLTTERGALMPYLVEHEHQRSLGEQLVLAYGRKELQRVVDPVRPRIFVKVL
jgi:hypothetical protein